MQLFSSLAVILLLVAPAIGQDGEPKKVDGVKEIDFLKIVPADALVFVLPDQERAAKRIDKLQEDVGFPNFGIKGKQAIAFLRSIMGATEGADEKAPLLAILVDPAAGGPQDVVFAVPIEDLARLLESYKVEPGDVAEGKIADGEMSGFLTSREKTHVLVHKEYVWVSGSKDNLKKVITLESLHDRLNPVRRAELADVGLMIHVGAQLWDAENKADIAKELGQLFGKSESGKHVLNAVMHLDSAQATLSLTEGVRVGLQINFDGTEPAEQSLAAVFGEGESNITGLPDGNLLIAGALHGTSHGTASLLSEFDWNLGWFFGRSAMSINPSAISALFGDLAAHIDNTSIGWYLNENPENDGTMSLVSILDPAESPEKLIEELRSLATFVSIRNARKLRIDSVVVDDEEIRELIKELGGDYQTRVSAGNRLRIIGSPVLPALDKAAKSEEERIAKEAKRLARSIRNSEAWSNQRAIQNQLLAGLEPKFLYRKRASAPERPIVEILLKPGEATTRVNKQLTSLFGPEWKRIRLAVLEKHVVVLFGSDKSLLDRTVAQVERGAIPAEMENTIKAARKNFKGQRLGEWHFSLPSLTNATYGAFKKPDEVKGLFSTVTFLKRKGQIRTDIYLPTKDLKAAFEADTARRNR